MPRRLDRAGSCAASSDADRVPRRHGARKSTALLEHARCSRGGARGLVVSPGCLLQYQLVECQIRHRSTQPGVLRFQVLQPLHLVALQPAEFLAPAVVRHLADTNRTDRLGHALALRGQNINLAQLGDDLLRLVALSRHRGPPWSKNHSSGWTTSLGADQLRCALSSDQASSALSTMPAR